MSERIYGVASKGWPVVKGCLPSMSCSPRCWAVRECHRLADNPNPKIAEFHRGLTDEHGHWTGTVKLNEAHLTDPLRWRKPAVIATAYHGDIFRLPHEQIDRVFAVMALCPQHVFLTLTKCAKEMAEYCSGVNGTDRFHDINVCAQDATGSPGYGAVLPTQRDGMVSGGWPLPNLYLGFSASNQSEFDARWPHVAKLAAAGWKVWTSLEPLIGPVDVSKALPCGFCEGRGWYLERFGDDHATPCPHCIGAARRAGYHIEEGQFARQTGGFLSQIVLGGESGPNARPCDVAWLRSIVRQCRDAGVPCFVKQLGAYSFDGSAPLPMTAPCGLKEIENRIALKHSKGADPSEWPEDLRVQELAWEVGR